MIYFDNAATTMPKPACVTETVITAMNSFGNSGRAVHGAGDVHGQREVGRAAAEHRKGEVPRAPREGAAPAG